MLLVQFGEKQMAFSPNMIVPASKSTEFSQASSQERTAKTALLEGIERQVQLYKDPTSSGRRWFAVGQKEIAISLRVSNQQLKIVGDETKVAVPIAHFEDAMKHFAKEVRDGKFDTQLVEADKAMVARREKIRKTRAANKSS